MFNLDRCNGKSNTLYDPSDRICVSNKTEDVNLSIFNMMTRIYESKTLTKLISCERKCKFDKNIVIQIKSGIKINVIASVKIRKNVICAENIIFGILVCELVKIVHIWEILLVIQ